MTDATRFELRAREAVATLLARRLMVPTVFFEPRWPGDQRRADVVAIDRAGSGDLHAIEIALSVTAATAHVPAVLGWPAPFRWLAYSADHADARASDQLVEASHSPDGAGRIGLIQISRTASDSLKAGAIVNAERFPGSFASVSAEFVRLNKPDIEPDNPDLNAPPATRADQPDESEVRVRAEEARKLLALQLWVPSFVTAWIAAEGAMRLAAARADIAADVTSPRALAKSLHANDLLTAGDLGILLASFDRRNRVVHGLSGVTIDPREVEAVLRVAGELIDGPAAALTPR